VTPSRRGLYAKRALRAGERLRAADLPLLLERPLTRDLRHGEPFTLADLPLEKAS
jgi:hypothetical protein